MFWLFQWRRMYTKDLLRLIHDDVHSLKYEVQLIMVTQVELAERMRALKAQNDKATAEQMAALQKVQDALAQAGNTTPEVDAAMEELAASIQRDDDLNPDVTP
jgi:seryl-tRNA synthetase